MFHDFIELIITNTLIDLDLNFYNRLNAIFKRTPEYFLRKHLKFTFTKTYLYPTGYNSSIYAGEEYTIFELWCDRCYMGTETYYKEFNIDRLKHIIYPHYSCKESKEKSKLKIQKTYK